MRIPCSRRPAWATSLARRGVLLQALLGCGNERPVTDHADAESVRPGQTVSNDADAPGDTGAQFDTTEPAAREADASFRDRDADTDARPAQGGAGNFAWTAGDYPPELHEQSYLEITGVPGQVGKTRQYKVHVPPSYRAATPAAVLFAFHGYLQNAVQFVVDATSFVAKSEQEGFILVMPNGLQEDGVGGSWNAGTCCGEAAAQKLDDVALVRAIHAELRKHLNVDTSRVYASGLSNGGFMSYRLGCEAADIFAAIAPVAGAIGTAEMGAWLDTTPDPDLTRCEPAKPVAVLAMHGDADEIVPYAGMTLSLDHWARSVGCGAATTAAKQPESGDDTRCITYASCPHNVEVTGCTVHEGGHCWFGDPGCGTGFPGIGNLFVGNNSDSFNASDAVWAFLKRFRR